MPRTHVDVVLLVHGTAPSSRDDEGQEWWQRTSDFWTKLGSRLRGRAVCAPAKGECLFEGAGDHVFHWTGDNSEQRRRLAGRDLLDNWLLRFEKGPGGPRSYHLVGHSHGGSVIWHALLEAERRGENLKNLRSWTTVGTPFLHYTGRRSELWLAAPLLVTVSVAYAVGGWYADFLREVSFDSPLAFSLKSAAGLALLAVLVLAILYFGNRIVSAASALLKRHRDRKIEVDVLLKYSPRYLGLWTREDEAINVLRGSLGGLWSTDFVPRLPGLRAGIPGLATILRSPRMVPGWLVLLPFRALYYGLVAPIYNRILAPLVGEFILAFFQLKTQGNDLTGQVLVDVTSGPVAGVTFDELPEDVQSLLLSSADAAAKAVLPEVRESLVAVSQDRSGFQIVAGRLRQKLTWNELIHTSYFDYDRINERVWQNIERGCVQGDPGSEAAADVAIVSSAPTGEAPARSSDHRDRQAIRRWLEQASTRFAGECEKLDPGDSPVPKLGRTPGEKVSQPRPTTTEDGPRVLDWLVRGVRGSIKGLVPFLPAVLVWLAAGFLSDYSRSGQAWSVVEFSEAYPLVFTESLQPIELRYWYLYLIDFADMNRAIADIESIQNSPMRESAIGALAEAAARKGDVATVESLAKRFAAGDGRPNAEILRVAAEILTKNGRPKDAQHLMRGVASEEGKDFQLGLAVDAYAKRGSFEEALAVVKDIPQDDFKVEAWIRVAAAMTVAGDRDGAKRELDAIRTFLDKANIPGPGLYPRLAVAYRKANFVRESNDVFETAGRRCDVPGSAERTARNYPMFGVAHRKSLRRKGRIFH
ncbi:MAG: hypothetical protein ACLQGP_11695 [Isosphaeraceae bacterium]